MKLLCCPVAAAVPHYLEAWNDLSLVKGTFFDSANYSSAFQYKTISRCFDVIKRNYRFFYDYIKILVLQLFQVHLGIKYYMMVFFVSTVPTRYRKC
jgi:hypothetical protein